ncbi:outer membrane beta-barrel protein [Vibrio cholerae]
MIKSKLCLLSTLLCSFSFPMHASNLYVGAEYSSGSINGGNANWHKYIDNDKSTLGFSIGSYLSDNLRIYGYYEKDKKSKLFSYPLQQGSEIESSRFGLSLDYIIQSKFSENRVYFPIGFKVFSYETQVKDLTNGELFNKSHDGYGLGPSFSVGYKLSKHASIEAGWKWMFLDDSSDITQSFISSTFKF